MRTIEKTRKLRQLLLEWYALHKRDLPWRARREPYEIWVSEIMLQQTRVQTVIPYYEKFLRRFPTIHALAEAKEEEVISFWAGLGYYSRARNLHRAAKLVGKRHQGNFPEKLLEIIELPGVGRYTAGAIASIAFNEPVPIVDGNARRVISRVHGIESRPPEAYFWNIAKGWIPEGKASEFNQAVMELGAVVCTPATPLCSKCPVQSLCEARKRGIQDKIPVRQAMPEAKTVRLVMLVVEGNGRVFLSRRREVDYIPGEWGLPTSPLEDGDRPEQAARALAREFAFDPIRLDCRGQVRHGITFRRIVIDVFHGTVPASANWSARRKRARWVPLASAERLLTSSAFRKALATALNS